MKTRIIATMLATSALAASAQNGETYGQTAPALGTPLSRAEVLAELDEAQQMDTIAYGNFSNVDISTGAGKSRDAVLAERRIARQEGKIRYGNIPQPGGISR